MVITFSCNEISYHLPGTVDAISLPGIPAQVSHPHPIRAGNEGTIALNRAKSSHHLPCIVNTIPFVPNTP